ncbi:Hypothetical protein BN69_2729 [Methylocystis sp. SC2]|nr:Hypothetical protein BN69_2729 [Methylocystis sp. SC2]
MICTTAEVVILRRDQANQRGGHPTAFRSFRLGGVRPLRSPDIFVVVGALSIEHFHDSLKATV